MKGYHANIDLETTSHSNFRKVLYTGRHSQLVLMSLSPGEEIGREVHGENDQFFRIEAGSGQCFVDDNVYEIKEGDAIIVPAGAEHNIVNTSDSEDLKLHTIYSPPHHQDGIVRLTKEEAEANEANFDGVTSE